MQKECKKKATPVSARTPGSPGNTIFFTLHPRVSPTTSRVDSEDGNRDGSRDSTDNSKDDSRAYSSNDGDTGNNLRGTSCRPPNPRPTLPSLSRARSSLYES